jgi:hypothetical protein
VNTCIGCYVNIADDQEFCKTCLDRRKAPRTGGLSTGRLEPSQYFEGFTDPFTGNIILNNSKGL